MNCRNCGAPIEPGARFCRKCGTSVPETPAAAPKKNILNQAVSTVKGWFDRPIFRNKRALMMIGGAALLLILVIVLIASVASCAGRKTVFKTPEALVDAVVDALERGDGDRLTKMAALSEEVCGAHPELFGDGKDAHAVMQGYYRTLASDAYASWRESYGKRFELEAKTETELLTLSPIYSGSSLYEMNRALQIDATQYATITGPLLIGTDTVATISLTAVEWDGGWRLLIVYLL